MLSAPHAHAVVGTGSAAALLSAAPVVPASIQAPSAQTTPVGFWVTEDRAWTVVIGSCADGLCGRVVGLGPSPRPDVLRTDIQNPDPARRTATLCGLPVLGGFRPSGDEAGAWDDGWVYDPENGKTYKGAMKLEGSDTLNVRGYIMIELFGRSEKLARVNGPARWCSNRPGVATGA